MSQALLDTSPVLKVDLPTSQLHVRQFQQAMQDYEQRHAAWKAQEHPRAKEPEGPSSGLSGSTWAGPKKAPLLAASNRAFQIPSKDNAMLYDYPGYRDCRSFCNLDLTILPGGATFVICAEHPDNPGTSVTNRAEFLATKVCRENAAINPLRLTWIEHYPQRGSRLNPIPPTWSVVTFDYDAATRTLRHPNWRYTDRQEIDQLRTDLLTLPPLQNAD